MTKATYKLVLLLRRRPGMSVKDFRDYYETRHRLIGEKFSDGVVRYVRRYLDPAPQAIGAAAELPFDVITEVWFDDKAIYDQVLAATATGNLPDEVIADEERLFDRPKSRVACVTEVESTLWNP